MTALPPSRRWVAADLRDEAEVHLLCLPYAGGGAAAYRGWGGLLPPEIDVVPVQLPGREGRVQEQAFNRMDPLVDALVHALAPWLARPFALFGHSMGALIAYELAARMSPVRLFIAGHPSPGLPSSRIPVHDIPDEAFTDSLRTLGGTPAEVLAHPELMALLLPLLRADFELCETYEFSARPPLSCPVSVFGGLADPLASAAGLNAWAELTSAACTVRTVPGGHFFLGEARELVLHAVARDLLG